MYDTFQLQIQILCIGFIKGGDSETVLLEAFRIFFFNSVHQTFFFYSLINCLSCKIIRKSLSLFPKSTRRCLYILVFV